MAKHYCYGSGMIGCLYDYGPHFSASKEEAIESLLFTFDDLRPREKIIMRHTLEVTGYYEFRNPGEAGAHYCDISEHEGECPENDNS